MKIRLLGENEIQMAINVAHETYRECVLPFVRMEEEVKQYNSYVNLENLWKEVHEGRLLIWGLFEAEELCAVSAMQTVGHITMLYVRRAFQKKGYGTALLDWMRGYAKETLRLKKVTVNVTPLFSESFFQRVGFKRMKEVMYPQIYFVSMEAKVKDMPEVKPERVIRWNVIMGVIIGTLVLVVAIAFSYNIYDAATRECEESAVTEEFWQNELKEGNIGL